MAPLAVALLLVSAAARAHTFDGRADLGQLTLGCELVVRGTIVRASRAEGGALLAAIRVDKVLRGALPQRTAAAEGAPAVPELVFASDPNHGVRYAAGERAVVFLRGRAAECGAPPCPPYSPQLFANKFRITSFDPTGYDGLIEGLPVAAAIVDPVLRARALDDLLKAQRNSPEKAVRDFAERRLSAAPAAP